LTELERSVGRDSVTYDGVSLPPPYLRSNGIHHRQNKAFLESGRAEAQRLADEFAIRSDSSVLDIGCGAGRLPLGLVEVNPVADYLGVDIDRRAIDWCRRHITPNHPTYRFEEIDVYNERYSRTAPALVDTLELPAEEASFDIVYSHSVLAALSEEDTIAYFRIFRRYLKPGGQIFLTAFVEEDADPVTEAYPYPLERGERAVTLWSEEHLHSTMSDEGFTVDRLELHIELDNQAAIHITLPE
jgi:SAM-dependent methyltransferase